MTLTASLDALKAALMQLQAAAAVVPPPPQTPIYVDPSLVLCAGYLTGGEVAAFQARLDLVSSPYIWVVSQDRYYNASAVNGYYGWKQSIDALGSEVVGAVIHGDMEHPWATVVQFDAASSEAQSPGSTQIALNEWSLDANFQAEFARCVGLGVPGVSALTVATYHLVSGVKVWDTNTNATITSAKIVQAKLWNDARDYAVVTKGAAVCSQAGGLGIPPLNGFTRTHIAAFEIGNPGTGIEWITGDHVFFRPLEEMAFALGLPGAASQSMKAAHAANDLTNPWMPISYLFYPIGAELDSLVAKFSIYSGVHRYVGATLAEPPYASGDGNRYNAKSYFRRVISAIKAGLVAATGNAADADINIWPVIYPSAVSPDLANSYLGTQHLVGLWTLDPAELAEVYASLFDAETDIAAGALLVHRNPTGLVIWTDVEFYFLVTMVAASSTATDAVRFGFEKMVGLLPLICPGELVGDVDAAARATYIHGKVLGDAFYVTGTSQKWFTVAGGDQTGRGWNPFASIIGQYLNPLVDQGQPEIMHAWAMWVSEYGVSCTESLRAKLTVRGY